MSKEKQLEAKLEKSYEGYEKRKIEVEENILAKVVELHWLTHKAFKKGVRSLPEGMYVKQYSNNSNHYKYNFDDYRIILAQDPNYERKGNRDRSLLIKKYAPEAREEDILKGEYNSPDFWRNSLSVERCCLKLSLYKPSLFDMEAFNRFYKKAKRQLRRAMKDHELKSKEKQIDKLKKNFEL